MSRTVVIKAMPKDSISVKELRYILPPQMWGLKDSILENQFIIVCRKQDLRYMSHEIIDNEVEPNA